MKFRSVTNEISEKNASGTTTSYSVRTNKTIKNISQPRVHRLNDSNDDQTISTRAKYQNAIIDFLKRVFLPKGYPDSVPPGGYQFQACGSV
jgi:hypothetical protein